MKKKNIDIDVTGFIEAQSQNLCGAKNVKIWLEMVLSILEKDISMKGNLHYNAKWILCWIFDEETWKKVYAKVHPKSKEKEIEWCDLKFIKKAASIIAVIISMIPEETKFSSSDKLLLFKYFAETATYGFMEGRGDTLTAYNLCRWACNLSVEEYKKEMEVLGNFFDDDGCLTGEGQKHAFSLLVGPKPEPPSGKEPAPAPSKVSNDSYYSFSGLNVDGASKDVLLASVKRFIALSGKEQDDVPRMNILLYGLPGTGKTEFVKFIGRETGKEVKTVMGSDILGKYVGETEKSIKNAFSEASEKGQILFFDEIDGVLSSRENANQSWEVTQVNELLNCMENFNGIFFAATNLLDMVDKAALRRFTFKAEFLPLTDEGKTEFWNRFFTKTFNVGLSDESAIALKEISHLTPGDFRTVRQSLFYAGDTVCEKTLLSALKKEVESKGFKPENKIGFSH